MSDVYIPTTQDEAIDYAHELARECFAAADAAEGEHARLLQEVGNKVLNLRAFIVKEKAALRWITGRVERAGLVALLEDE